MLVLITYDVNTETADGKRRLRMLLARYLRGDLDSYPVFLWK